MSIITFWNDDREQSGKTLTSVAVATRMAIDRNFKVLLMSTSFRDSTMKNCFFGDEVQRNLKIFGGKSNNIAVENGIEGLSKLVTSKKITPEVITDYTKVVFKGRLEVLCGYVGAGDKTVDENYSEYERLEESYIDLIRNANLYYDMVVVDLDKNLKKEVKDEIKRISNLNIFVFSQRLARVNRYNKLKEENEEYYDPKFLPVIGKYDNRSNTYNIKNITKYLGEKKEINVIPYNILYFEAAEENNVADLFLRLKRNLIKEDRLDDNYLFMQAVEDLVNKILRQLQELQKKMR